MKMLPLPKLIAVAGCSLALSTPSHADLTEGMKTGSPEMKSVSSLCFGPDGILFAADPKGAAVYAFATGDTSGDPSSDLAVKGVDKAVAGLLGVTADDILINDLAVNPASGNIYLSVSRGKGPDGLPVIVCIGADGKPKAVKLDGLKHSKLELNDAPEDKETGEGRRRSNKRMESITDLAYTGGQLAIAGLSNEEFASTLRTAAFPFQEGVDASSIEIYHGAHGKEETHSPIRTFLPMVIGGEPNIVASYTCTPLVTIPIKDLKPKAHVKGKTVAELGNRNRPLDMIEYDAEGKKFILIANSARGIMKVSTENITEVDPINERVGGGDTAGLSYDTIDDWQGIVQLDKCGDSHAVVIRSGDDGVHLETKKLP